MYPIIAPITIGQSGSNVQNLQDVLLFLVQKGDIVLSNNFPLTNIHEERLQSFFGDATAACVKAFCTQFQLQSNPQELVNQDVADRLNQLLTQYPEAQPSSDFIKVSGIVRHISGNLFTTNYTVRVEQVLFSGNVVKATTQIDATGFYSVNIERIHMATVAENYTLQCVVEVEGQNFPSSKVYVEQNATQQMINISIDHEIDILSEYATLSTKVQNIIGQMPIADISTVGEDSQMSFIAGTTGEGTKEIFCLITAHQLSDQLNNLNPELFYGLLRQNMPKEPEQLLFQPTELLKTSLLISTQHNIIGNYSTQDINAFIVAAKDAIVRDWNDSNLGDVKLSATFRIYNKVFNNTAITNDFMSLYFAYEADGTNSFWDYLATQQTYAAHIKELVAITEMAPMSGSNPALAAAMLAIIKGGTYSGNKTLPITQGKLQPELLAGLDSTDWLNVVNAAKSSDSTNFFYPLYVEGQNDQTRNANYAQRLYANFMAVYPTHSISAKIVHDINTAFPAMKTGLSSFLTHNPTFDLRVASLMDLKATENPPFDYTGISNKEAFIEEIATAQRLLMLTSSYDAMSAMAKDGLVSAFHITRAVSEEFVTTYSSLLGDEEAALSVYETAASVTTHAVLSAYEVYFDAMSDPAPWTGIDPSVLTPIGTVPSSPTVDPYAEWRTLFGSLDGCTCCHCQSIYSPSAYLVDTLHFLKTKGALDVHNKLIDERRKEIKYIELSCDNTNIPLPYIDIVNELLEDIVGTGGYNMYARQTKSDAEHLRAIPEYINTEGYNATIGTAILHVDSPYPKLKNAAYPWTLPYNFYKREIETHLSIASVKGYELVQRFSAFDQLNAFANTQFCIAYLGISNEEATIINTSATALYTQLQLPYGFSTSYSTVGGSLRTYIPDPKSRGSFISIAPTVGGLNWDVTLTDRLDVFLQQTKLSYKELLELLDCYFLNAVYLDGRRLAILNNSTTSDITTCKLYELKIDPVDFATDIPPFLNKLHRYVRLCKALGWTYYELDKALRCINADDITESVFVKIVQMKYVVDTLHISVEDACTLWLDIESLPYRDYGHEDEECELEDIPNQYLRIFRNPALINAIDGTYPFWADGTIHSVPKDKFRNYMSGIASINPNDMEFLLEEAYALYNITTDPFTPTIQFLSYIYRQTVLIKALKISVKDWLYYKKWISNDNYFGNEVSTTDAANNTAAKPISVNIPSVSTYRALPFDTIRFIKCVRLFKDTGLKSAEIEYLLLDAPTDSISDDKFNDSIALSLTGLRAELAKKWYPDFDAADDNANIELLQILKLILTEPDAIQLMDILNRVLTGSSAYTTEEYLFVQTQTSFFLPSGSENVLAKSTHTSYLSNIEDRYNYVYNNQKLYMRQEILKPAAANFLSNEFKLEESIAYLLLDQVIVLSGKNGFDHLLDKNFVTSTATLHRWKPTDNQFSVILLLHKATIIITKFGLGLKEVQYLWLEKITASPSTPVIPDIPILSDLPIRAEKDSLFVPGTSSTVTFRFMRNLLQWMQVRAFTGADINILFAAIQASDANIVDVIATVFKMADVDANSLLATPATSSTDHGLLHINPAKAFRIPLTYLRVIDCLEMQYLLPAPMTTLAKVATATRTAASQSDAADVIHLVKAPFDDKQWLEVIQPVNDILRVERRDALVSFLLAYPPYPYEYSWLSSLDIYETLMVDVEMMPIVSTTRVLLAVNTVQLWADRVLLQLESVTMPNNVARQWHMWRRLYRLWEANRKVFLYPENWIEPELRDNKSPFFLELEKFLKQNEVTKDNVEEAYKTYLERLDQVSHLDIIGIYRQTDPGENYQSFNVNNNNVVHAFGRTKSHPHIYFYRNRANKQWSAWEKMDTQIDGDHFIPIMWRGRLRLYWFVFTKDQEQQSMSGARNSDDAFITPPGVRWKIELAWTEYKNKKWTAKEVCKEPLYSRFIYEEMPTSRAHMDYYSGVKAGESRVWNLNQDLEKIKRESFNFFCNITADGNLQFRVVERYYGIHQGYVNGILSRYTNPSSPLTLIDRVENTMDQVVNYMDFSKNWCNEPQDYFATNGAFNVKFNGVTATTSPAEDPGVSLFKDDIWHGPALKDLQNNAYWPENTDYWYRFTPEFGYRHYPDGNIKLLDYAPGHSVIEGYTYKKVYGSMPIKKRIVKDKEQSKYLVFPRHMPAGYSSYSKIEVPYFFYKDYKNAFFVEKTAMPRLSSVTVLMESTGTISKIDAKSGTGIGLSGGIPISGTASGTGIIGTATASTSISTATGYRFHNFTHDGVHDFMEILFNEGLDGLLNRHFITDTVKDKIDFLTIYKPTANVVPLYPDSKVDFSEEGAYSLYNWELFFHIPLLIANKLSQDQQFDDARTWYHYIFNPTNNEVSTTVKKFWNFPPFYNIATSVPSVADAMTGPGASANIAKWAENPFNPHLVARTRPSAYMKNTVNKYLDNLIAWGDNLFRSDSREAINEATLLYVLAAQILGRRPKDIPARAKPELQTYDSLDRSGTLNDFGNAMVNVESVLLSSGAVKHYHLIPISSTSTSLTPKSYWPPLVSYTGGTVSAVSLLGSMYYFCTPTNDKLLQYWDILADRLFKIRNSQNIDGITRELALFDPPIDPAILVKAAAAGLSLAGVIGDVNAQLPSYRFNVLAQKATELVQEVKSLGGQLLSALEKKDAEHISLLRSAQEINVLEAVTELKEYQIQESGNQFDALKVQLKNTTQRRDHYQQLINTGLIGKEQTQLASAKIGLGLTIAQGTTAALASIVSWVPNVMIGAFSAGAQTGGDNASNATRGAADSLGIAAAMNNHIGTIAGINAGFERRKQDWQLQLKLANTEIEQLNKQIIAAEIRLEMAKVELKNHQLQISNAQEMNTAMRDKYTNEELYDWMIGQISFTYFQGYKLAYETAKKAERCFRYELNLDTSDYIQYGYWDSLKKGLLAGESLSYDLKRMEAAYLDKNKRQLELTKHISLAALNPDALMDLRLKKICQIELPEWLFDMDYPGQHMRRIKSVSISIPCVSGPYTTISCKLSLQSSKYRKNAFTSDDGYPEDPGNDSRFTYLYGNIQSIATSSAQNDSGMFEMNFRDERYLPFEGCGAISKWTIELPAAYAQFDYNSISDLILHVKYTAQDSGALKQAAIANITDIFTSTDADKGLYRLFNLKQEFSNEWHQLINGTQTALVLDNIKARLPYLVQGKTIENLDIHILTDKQFNCKLTDNDANPSSYNSSNETPVHSGVWKATLSDEASLNVADKLYLHIDSNHSDVLGTKECWLVLHYTAS